MKPTPEAWFAGSCVVDEAGRPLTVYHGTHAHFRDFRVPAFFAEDREEAEAYGPRIVAAHLRIENPYEPEETDLLLFPDEEFITWLQEQGYDGLAGCYLSAATQAEERIYVAFSPDQIRLCDEPAPVLSAAEQEGPSP